jgi:hypothetical protein
MKLSISDFLPPNVDGVYNFTFRGAKLGLCILPPAPSATPTLPPETPTLPPRCKFDTGRYGKGYEEGYD